MNNNVVRGPPQKPNKGTLLFKSAFAWLIFSYTCFNIFSLRLKFEKLKSLTFKGFLKIGPLSVNSKSKPKALGIIKISEKRIAALKDISTTKLTDQIEKRKILAENKIEQLVRDTNNSIKNYISSVAIEATRNILLQNLSKDKKSDLIEESIIEFNSVLKS